MNILVCDDDHAIVDAIEIYLSQEGYRVLKAYDGLEAIKMLQEHEIHLILIDIMMPKMDGMRATMKIRETSGVPIIFLSAKSEDVDKILGLNIGADDYITKPFSLSVLRARVQACLRRSARLGDQCLYSGRFSLDLRRCRLFDEEKEIAVTATEFKLLSLFIRNAGQVLSKEQILDALWDVDGNFIDANTVPVNINRIRNKIEKDPRNPTVLKTIHGIGYMWDQEGTLC